MKRRWMDRTLNRRKFIVALGAGGMAWPRDLRAEARTDYRSLAGVGGAPVQRSGRLSEEAAATRLVILHTNDTHSRLDPFPADDGPFAGLGGAARRATLIRRIRAANEHVLLVDSGDIFQGTPYFNFFGGEAEFRVMTAMGYDVATLGNHDFDNGVDGLARMLPEAGFEFVSANYDVSASALDGHVQPWTVREFGGVRVGIFGLGIAFERLVLASLHEGVRHIDPVQAARRACRALRAEGCALIVCLSHLGYRYRSEERPSDLILARDVPEIDLILGGHTHTFMEQADVFDQGRTGFTLVNQVGWGGMRLGRIDVAFAETEAVGWGVGGYEVNASLD